MINRHPDTNQARTRLQLSQRFIIGLPDSHWELVDY